MAEKFLISISNRIVQLELWKKFGDHCCTKWYFTPNVKENLCFIGT